MSYNYVNTWGYGDMKHPEKLKGMVGPLIRHEIDIGGNSKIILKISKDSKNAIRRNRSATTKVFSPERLDLALKTLDFAISLNSLFLGVVLFITSDRIPFIEYLSVTLPVKFAFVFRAPPLSYVSNIYYLPFNTVVWICGIILVVVSTTIVYITYRVSKENIEHLMASDFLLFTISTVCQMGSNMILKKSSGRIATVI